MKRSLSRFCHLCGILLIPVSLALVVIFKRRYGRAYESNVEYSPEEVLAEMDREFTPLRRTTIRTQTEYLPFLFECIRENIDSGFEDPRMLSLLERVERHRPNEERCARFSVVANHQRSNLHLRWVRDSCDRILLRIQGAGDAVIVRTGSPRADDSFTAHNPPSIEISGLPFCGNHRILRRARAS